MAGSFAREALASPCSIHSETETKGEALSQLLTHKDLVLREQQNRIDQARESGGPTVPGFGSLEALEAEQQRIASELAKAKQDVASRQQQLERAILQHETLKENVEVGDQLCERFKGMIEHGIDEFIEGRISKSPDSEVHILRTLNEIPARQLFIEHWPSVRKAIQGKVKELDRSIKNLMEKGGKE